MSMFSLEETSGEITVSQSTLDREDTAEYTLEVEARDCNGHSNGLFAQATVHITIADVNDNAPTFTQEEIQVTVNKGSRDITVATIAVEDRDEKLTENWRAVYKISGDTEEIFSISTDPNTNEGVLRLAKEIYTDMELQVLVENEVPLVAGVEETSVAGRTCRVLVSMLGEVGRIQFVPPVTKVHIQETVLAGQILAVLSAQDTENNSNENMRYAIHEDEANLLDIDAATGKLSARADLKRDSPFLQNDKYTALVTATLEGEEFGTATGTVLIVVRDSEDSDSGQRPIVLHTTACVRDENSSVSIDIAATDAQGAFVGSPPFEFFVDSQDQGWVITQMDGSRAKLSVESGTLPCGDYFIPVMGVDAAGSELGLSVQLTVCRCEDGPAIVGVLPVQDGKTGLCLSSGGLAAILCSIIAAPLLGVVFLALLRKWFTRREVENKGFIQAASSDDVQCESQGQRRLETVIEEVNVESSTSTHRSASGSRPTLLMEKSTKIRHSEAMAISKGDEKTLTCVHEDSLSQSCTKAKKEHIAEEELLMRATGALISDINAGQTNVNVSRLNYRDETEGQEDASMEAKVKATRSVEVLSEQDLVRYNRALNGKDKVSVDFGNSHASSCHLQLQDKAITVMDERNVEVIYGSEDGGDKLKRQDLEYKVKSANVLKSEHMATSTVTSNKGNLKTTHIEKLEVRDLDSTGAFSRADSEMGLRTMSQAVMQQAYRQGVNVLPDTPVSSLHTTHSNTLEAGTGTATHLPGSSLAVSRQSSGAKTQMQVSSLHVKSADHLTSVDFGSRPAASDTVSTNDSVSSVYHGHSSNMVIPVQTELFADHQSMDKTATFMSLVKSEQSEITNSLQSQDVSESGSRQGSNTFEGNEVTFDSSSTLQGSGVQDRSSLSTKTMTEGRSVTPAIEAVKHAQDYPMVVTSGDCQGASGATLSKASRSTISSFSSSQPSSTTTQTEPLSPSQFREEPGQFTFQSSEVIIESQAGDTVKFGTKQTSKTSDIRRVQFDNASQEDHSLSGNTKLILEGRRTDVSSLAGGTHIIDIQKGMQYSTVVGNRSKGTSIGGVPEIITTSASTYSAPVSTHQSSNMQTEPSKTLFVKSVQHSVGGGQEGNIATAGTGLIQGSSSSFSAGETTSVKTTMLSSQTLNKSKDSSSEANVLHSKPRQCKDSSSDVHGETLQSLECSGKEFEHRVIQRVGSQEQQSVLETMNSTIEGKQKHASPSLKSDTKVIFKKQRSYTGDVEFGVQSTTRANSINSSSGLVSSLSSIQQNKIERPLLPALATSLEHTVGDTSEVYSTSADIWSKKSSLSSFSSDEHSRNTIQGQTISSIPANKGKRLDVTESFTPSTQPDGLRQGSVQLKCPEEISKKQEKENQAGNLVTQKTFFSSIQKKPQKEMTNASSTFIESGTEKLLSESTQLNTKLKPAENPIPLCTNKTLVQPSSITNSGIQYADKMPNSVSIRGSEASAIPKLHGSSLGAGLSNAQGKWESSRGVPTALAATGSKSHGIVSEEFGHKQLTSPTKSMGHSHYASKSSSAGTISSDMGGGGHSTSYQISASDNTVEGHVKHAMSISQQATKYHLQPLHEDVAPVKGAAFSASLEQHSLLHQQNVSGASGRELLETADKSQAQLGGMVSTRMTSAPHAMQLQHSVASVQSQAAKVSQPVQLQRNMTHETTASQRTNQSDHREKEVSSHTSIHAKPSISGLKQARGGDETIRIVIDESNVTPEEEAGYFRSFHRYESAHIH
nr:uncharacterized protein LOC116948086 isoform X2 [Petromyzon marinus]